MVLAFQVCWFTGSYGNHITFLFHDSFSQRMEQDDFLTYLSEFMNTIYEKVCVHSVFFLPETVPRQHMCVIRSQSFSHGLLNRDIMFID